MKIFPKIALLLCLLAAMLCIARWASAETKIGFSWMHGQDFILPSAFQSEECTNMVNRFSFGIESNDLLPTGWEKWWVGGELGYAIRKADQRDGPHDAGMRTYSLLFTVKREMFNLFYVGCLAGIGYWYKRDVRPYDLGDSHFLGTFGVMVGKDWKIYKAWSLKTELRATHCSDPFQGDHGKYYLQSGLGLVYNF